MTTRQTVSIGKGKDEVVITVRRERGDKKHIFITAPSGMSWTKIWSTMRKLPRHLQNKRKKKRKEKQLKSKREATNQAVNLGIRTGDMPNISLIWAFQQSEEQEQCFGRIENCNGSNCRWHNQCKRLTSEQQVA